MIGLRRVLQFRKAASVPVSCSVRHQSGKFGLDSVHPTIGLNADQASFYELARGFADKELKPFAQEWDEKSHFPLQTFEKFAELGFAGMFVKDDVGGSALSRVDTTIIVEALATGCVGTTAMLTIHNMCAGMVDKFGSEAHRQE